MKDGEEIRVRPLSGRGRTRLSLSGSILTYRNKSWSVESLIDIPVELITFSEKKQFDGSRLIISLLSLIFLPAVAGAIIGVWYLVAGPPPAKVIDACLATGLMAGVIVFIFLLGRFFIRQKTITFHIAPENMTISFRETANRNTKLREIINEVELRKKAVQDTMPYPLQSAVGDIILQPWKRTAAATLIFMIPGYITEIPWLLLAGLIPVCAHIFRSLSGLNKPREFKQALQHLLKGELQTAEDLIDGLIRRLPDYLPAYLLMIELKLRQEDFDGAASTLAKIQNDLDAETLQSMQHDIVIHRRIAMRKRTCKTNVLSSSD